MIAVMITDIILLLHEGCDEQEGFVADAMKMFEDWNEINYVMLLSYFLLLPLDDVIIIF